MQVNSWSSARLARSGSTASVWAMNPRIRSTTLIITANYVDLSYMQNFSSPFLFLSHPTSLLTFHPENSPKRPDSHLLSPTLPLHHVYPGPIPQPTSNNPPKGVIP